MSEAAERFRAALLAAGRADTITEFPDLLLLDPVRAAAGSARHGFRTSGGARVARVV